jgi:hypothetical protein
MKYLGKNGNRLKMKKHSINRDIDQNTDFSFTYYPLDSNGNKLSSEEISIGDITAICCIKKYPSSSSVINLQTQIDSDIESNIFVKVYADSSQTSNLKEGTWFYDILLSVGEVNPIRSKILEGLIFVYPTVCSTENFISSIQSSLTDILNSKNREDIETYSRLIQSTFQSEYISPEFRFASSDDFEYDAESQRKMQRCCDAQRLVRNILKNWKPHLYPTQPEQGTATPPILFPNPMDDSLRKFVEKMWLQYLIHSYRRNLLKYFENRSLTIPAWFPLPAWLRPTSWAERWQTVPPLGQEYWPDELIPYSTPSYYDPVPPDPPDMRPTTPFWPWEEGINPEGETLEELFPRGIPIGVFEDPDSMGSIPGEILKFLEYYLSRMMRGEILTPTLPQDIPSGPCRQAFLNLARTPSSEYLPSNSDSEDCCTSVNALATFFNLINCLIVNVNASGIPGYVNDPVLGPNIWNRYTQFGAAQIIFGLFLQNLRRELLVGWLYCQFECAKRGYGDAGGPCGCLLNPCETLGYPPGSPHPEGWEDIISPYGQEPHGYPNYGDATQETSPESKPESWSDIFRNCLIIGKTGHGTAPGIPDPIRRVPLPGYPEIPVDLEGFGEIPIEQFGNACGDWLNPDYVIAINPQERMCCDCVYDLIPECQPHTTDPPCEPNWNESHCIPAFGSSRGILEFLSADTNSGFSGFTIEIDTIDPIDLDSLRESCGDGPTIPPKPNRGTFDEEGNPILTPGGYPVSPSEVSSNCKYLSATYLIALLDWIECISNYLENNHPNQHNDKKNKLKDLIRKIQNCINSCTNA